MSKLVFHIKNKTRIDESICGLDKNEYVIKFESWSFEPTCKQCLWLRSKFDPIYPEIPYHNGSRPRVIKK